MTTMHIMTTLMTILTQLMIILIILSNWNLLGVKSQK